MSTSWRKTRPPYVVVYVDEHGRKLRRRAPWGTLREQARRLAQAARAALKAFMRAERSK